MGTLFEADAASTIVTEIVQKYCKSLQASVTDLVVAICKGSTYTTIGELGPIIPSTVWYWGDLVPSS